MKVKQRTVYGILFAVLFGIELLIALFVQDAFIRPYVGDMLVTALLCCFCRTVFPKGSAALPLYVFLFAAAVELAQYFDVVKLLGLSDIHWLSVLVGRTFSVPDMICYAAGCLLFWGVDRIIRRL